MSLAFFLLAGLLLAMGLRHRLASALFAMALLCQCTAYGLWASFFGAIFGLPVFLIGMAVLVTVAGACAITPVLLRRSDLEIPYLLPFLRWLSGGLLAYSLAPLGFLVWFGTRLPDKISLPTISELVLLVALPTALPIIAFTGWRLGGFSDPTVPRRFIR